VVAADDGGLDDDDDDDDDSYSDHGAHYSIAEVSTAQHSKA
jgi:hypothetical protein